MKVIIAGDVFLGGDLARSKNDSIIDVQVFHNADCRVINLEQCISDNSKVANKSTLYTGSNQISILNELKINAVNLANNHIHNKTDDGIVETVQHLENGNIQYFGAGTNLDNARKPLWISRNLCLLAYCDFARSYLKQVRVATENEPGINPLRYEEIMKDLEQLPPGKKAILYFHWGREHVWLPPLCDIELAKMLLQDERVALIVGTHAHRLQGYIEHNGKRAYMCLGNFLFPNFFIKPPTQITYPRDIPEKYHVTKRYHSVSSLTYKKWKLVNRLSLVLQFDTESNMVSHQPVVQRDDTPVVTEVNNIISFVVLFWVRVLSVIYKFPSLIYKPLEKINCLFSSTIWRGNILLFKIRQNGVRWFFWKIRSRVIKGGVQL